jgi:hypothetical protein
VQEASISAFGSEAAFGAEAFVFAETPCAIVSSSSTRSKGFVQHAGVEEQGIVYANDQVDH